MEKSLKTALVIPGEKDFGQQQYPIGIGYLAALLLERGHDCVILDEIAGDNIQRELMALKPDVVGLTGTTMYIPKVYAHAAFARKNLKSKIIIGGPHASALPEEAIQYADIVIQNEAEGNFIDAVEGRIPGGIQNGIYVKNLDSLPLPAYQLLKMSHYLAQKDRIVGFEKRVGSLITSRGCPWKCTFCYNSFRSTPVRFHSAKRVIEEIAYLQKHYSIEGIYFCDDEFVLKPKRLAEICDYLKKENLIWECQAQVRSIIKHPEIPDILKNGGCVLLGVGLESGSERILADLKQGASTLELNQKVIELCEKAKLPIHGTFMIGNPGETLEDIYETERFIKKNRSALHYVSVLKTTPFPGTKIWEQCQELGLLKPPYDWRSFDCGPKAPHANENLSPEEIMSQLNRIIFIQNIRNYTLWQIIKRTWKYRRFILSYLPKFW